MRLRHNFAQLLLEDTDPRLDPKLTDDQARTRIALRNLARNPRPVTELEAKALCLISDSVDELRFLPLYKVFESAGGSRLAERGVQRPRPDVAAALRRRRLARLGTTS